MQPLQRLVKRLLQDQRFQRSLAAADFRQFPAVQQYASALRLYPDSTVSLATRCFASGSEEDPDAAAAAAADISQETEGEDTGASAVRDAEDEASETAQVSDSLASSSLEDQSAGSSSSSLQDRSEELDLERPTGYSTKGPGGLDLHLEKDEQRTGEDIIPWDQIEVDEDVVRRVKERGKRKLTRELRGSYVDNEELMDELDEIAPEIPESMPIYNIDELMPWVTEPESNAMDMMAWLQEHKPHLAELCIDHDETQPPFPGARPILRWEMTAVLSMNHAEEPADKNKKTKCRVYLRDLQEQARPPLSLDALHHIAAIAGPRYNPRKGELTLTSEKYPHREANRNHIMQMLHDLVAEGHKLMGVEGVPRDSQEPAKPISSDPAPEPEAHPQRVWHMPQQGSTVVWMQ